MSTAPINHFIDRRGRARFSCLLAFFLAWAIPLAAARKPTISEADRLRQNLLQLMGDSRFERALALLEENAARFDSNEATRWRLDLYGALKMEDSWERLLEALPSGPLKEAQSGLFWGARGWYSRAGACFERYFALGGRREDIRTRDCMLFTSSLQVPGYWLLAGTPKDTGVEFSKAFAFNLPYGAELRILFFDGTLRSTDVATVSRIVSGFRRDLSLETNIQECSFKPAGGSFKGQCRGTGAGFGDPEALLVSVRGENPVQARVHAVGLLVPDRGFDYRQVEFNRSGAIFEYAYYKGDPSESFFLDELEAFLDKLIH